MSACAVEKVKWGMLGTGMIASRLARAFKEVSNALLVGVASRDGMRAKAFADEHGVPRAYEAYDLLLFDEDVDAIIIALPNSLHCEWTVKAAEAKKHVMCEKPLATSVDECENMIEACKRNGVLLMEAAMYRFQPQVELVVRMISDGSIGEPRIFHGAFCFPIPNHSNIRYRPELGGGCIFDMGFYPVDFARLIANGVPVGLCAFGIVDSECGVEVVAAGTMQFPNGMLAQFECGFQNDIRTYAEIIGTEASVQMPDPWTSRGKRKEVWLLRRREYIRRFELQDRNSYALEIEHFSQCILSGSTPLIKPEWSMETVATLQKLRQLVHERAAN
ncbi:MAG: Gfo/Idh/MocA family oxidoreductase [Armatimonadota bacterium]|nr:Gfo/Idh/MocA family oxidoreductase [Armatimonadota bacterium]MCX7776731.1 Gfo/Idh/MocA family oxidoreductase [Armatimonadota bacterium]MDW8025800.1 Gfo/Idh/MocA family oxidoreductase [Armatimonadota bacterium]